MATFEIRFGEKHEEDATSPNLEKKPLSAPRRSPGAAPRVGIKPTMVKPPLSRKADTTPNETPKTFKPKRLVGGPVPLKNKPNMDQKKLTEKRRKQAIANFRKQRMG